MNDLRSALRQLRQEIAAALTESAEAAPGNRSSVVTVNLSLRLVWTRVSSEASADGSSDGKPSDYQWRVAEPGQTAVHTLQLSLPIQSQEDTSAVGSKVATESIPSTVVTTTAQELVEPEDLMSSCTHVFGEPGFDNSARAEVFADLATSLDPQRLLEAVIKAGDGRAIDENEPLHLEIRRLRRLLGYSPAGLQRAAEILRGRLERGESASLLRLLGERWNYGTHWELPGQEAKTS